MVIRLASKPHRLPLNDARLAAIAVIRGAHAGEHHTLAIQAHDEANAELTRCAQLINQIFQHVREQLRLLQPALNQTAAALAQCARHLDHHPAAQPAARKPHRRPAWQSPYGPAPTRRR